MKKILILSIILLFVFTICGCKKKGDKNKDDKNNNNNDTFEVKTIATSEDAFVWGAPNTISIMKDVKILNQCDFWGTEWTNNTDKLYADGIKGSCASFQLMFTARKDVSKFNVVSKYLKLDDSVSLSDDCIEIYAERYIETKSPSSDSRKASMFTGWYPDALVPMESYAKFKHNKTTNGSNQGIYINVLIPEDAKAGLYNGILELTVNESKFEVPYQIKVYDVTINEEYHSATAIDYWEAQIGNGEESFDEDGNIIDWSEIYYDFLLERRVIPAHIPNEGVNYLNYAKRLVQYASNPKVTGYRLIYKGTSKEFTDVGSLSVVDKNSLIELLTAMAQVNIELRQKGDLTTDLFKKAFYYFASIIDEPSGYKMNAVYYCDLCVTEAKKEVAELLNDYPDLKESLLRIPHVVTTTFKETLMGDEVNGGIQSFCTEIQRASTEYMTGVKERKEDTSKYHNGSSSWVYMTCTTNNPYSSFQLDDNLLGSRALHWMVFDYGFDCILFWNVCFYSKYTGSETVTRDIWDDPNSWAFANGDGYLLYPGSKYGLYTPIATLRLESFRQGSLDYEYLYMIKDYINAYNLDNPTDTIDVDKALDCLMEGIHKENTLTPLTNVDTFSQIRERVLIILEQLANNNTEGINAIKQLMK